MQIKRIINNDKRLLVKPIQFHEAEDKRPIKGGKIITELYSNIFLCAKKNSGKTTIVAKLLRECSNKDTTIIVFSSTLDKDKSWKAIKKELSNRTFVGHTSLKGEDGGDELQNLLPI
jgi:hypothetical protein